MHVRPGAFGRLQYSWRQAHAAGVFYQLDLVNPSGLRDVARRLDSHGGLLGADELERLDEAGTHTPRSPSSGSSGGCGLAAMTTRLTASPNATSASSPAQLEGDRAEQ